MIMLAGVQFDADSLSVDLQTTGHRLVVTLAVCFAGLSSFAHHLYASPTDLPSSALLPVTEGLVHWWPDPFSARDEVTGAKGVVMGLVAPEDQEPFSDLGGWVQLPCRLERVPFSIAFWMRWRGTEVLGNVLGMESSQGRWYLQQSPIGQAAFELDTEGLTPGDSGERCQISDGSWQYVTLALTSNRTAVVWVNGRRVLDGKLQRNLSLDAKSLTIGNSAKGDTQLRGSLRNLAVYDRLLTDREVATLHQAGLPSALVMPSHTAARALPEIREWSTNVVATSVTKQTYRRYTTENGLPDNQVQCVRQTRTGYLWVGTGDGLARFDGLRFKAFTTTNTPALAITGDDVEDIEEDNDGTLWAGLYGGLIRIRGIEFTAFTNGLPQRFVLRAQPAGDGTVWVAGYGLDLNHRGVCKLRLFDPQSETSRAEIDVPGQVRQLISVKGGVWLATEGPDTVFFWDGKSPGLRTVAKFSPDPPFMRISADSNLTAGPATVRTWCDPSDGTNRWAELHFGTNGPSFHWLWGPGRQISVSRWNGVEGTETWLGGRGGLARIDGAQLGSTQFPNRPAAPIVCCLCANREGGVWFGTEEDGLHFVAEPLVSTITSKDGLGANEVSSVFVSGDDALWVATIGQTSRLRYGRWESFKRPTRSATFAEDRQGRIWVAHGGGFTVGNPRALPADVDSQILPGIQWEEPNTLRLTSNGQLWLTDQLGITWIDPQFFFVGPSGTWTVTGSNAFGRFRAGVEIPPGRAFGIIEDRDQAIWAGQENGGLVRFKPQKVEVFTERDGLPAGICVPVHLDDSGELWILSAAGITRRKDGHFRTVRPEDGLPADNFYTLIEDDSRCFWLGGKRGIHRVERTELDDLLDGKKTTIRHLTLGVADGLLTPECTSEHYPAMAKTADGRIWVATRNGLACVDPRRAQFDMQPLPVIIEQVFAGQQIVYDAAPILNLAMPAGAARTKSSGQNSNSVARQPGVELKPGSGQRLEIHYTAASLTAPDRIRFRYRLEGYDQNWSADTDLRLAFYTNLRPGHYRFHVKACNSRGIWNDDESVLAVRILAFFWQTKTFEVAGILALPALAGLLHWRRLSAQRRFQELKHREAFAAERARIAADMHDDLGAALTKIAVLSEVTKAQLTPEAAARTNVENIAQSARQLTSQISDLVWATNPRNDSLENLSAYLREQSARQFEGSTIDLQLDFASTLPNLHVSATFRRNLVLIVKEALANVMKHSAAKLVRVSLKVDSNNLLVRIEDNGHGFDPAATRTRGNGLGNMDRRAKDLGGEVTIGSVPGSGTDVHIRLPPSR